jgi:hypothetical protein
MCRSIRVTSFRSVVSAGHWTPSCSSYCPSSPLLPPSTISPMPVEWPTSGFSLGAAMGVSMCGFSRHRRDKARRVLSVSSCDQTK